MFAHVPTRLGSTATLGFEPAGAVSDLTVDLDGDGRTDLTLAPTVLVGEATDDFAAPTLRIEAPTPGRAVVGTAEVRWTATDALSGLASSFALLDRGTAERLLASPGPVEFHPGPHRLEVFAEDRAANLALRERRFTAYAGSGSTPRRSSASCAWRST